MDLEFRAIEADDAGKAWSEAFRTLWPAYRSWWMREGTESRPTYMEGRRALKQHMPELLPLYGELCELAGGSDQAARFLSFWCPPAYLSACSQAVWPGQPPLLVRNYDYSADAFDAIVLRSHWGGRTVLGSSDGMWGLVDGINDAGLAVSLTFGGRRVVGEGFGVPLIMRYVLQTCERADEAAKVLARVPTHMSYNVTVVDVDHQLATVYMAPDRESVISRTAVATNHQERVEWSSHARWTATVERERYLLQRLTLHVEPMEKFIGAFLKPPLYSVAFNAGFGTLYTVAYRPRSRQMALHWPGACWQLSLDEAVSGSRSIRYPG